MVVVVIEGEAIGRSRNSQAGKHKMQWLSEKMTIEQSSSSWRNFSSQLATQMYSMYISSEFRTTEKSRFQKQFCSAKKEQ